MNLFGRAIRRACSDIPVGMRAEVIRKQGLCEILYVLSGILECIPEKIAELETQNMVTDDR